MHIAECIELHLNSLHAAGTSEGAEKGWDTRGRHDKKADKHLGRAIDVAKSAGFKTTLGRLQQIQRAGSGPKGYSESHGKTLGDLWYKHDDHAQSMGKGISSRLMDKTAQAHMKLSNHLLDASEAIHSKFEAQ